MLPIGYINGDPGKYALLGAAAMLGGVVRMTISLTVILIGGLGQASVGVRATFIVKPVVVV